MSASDNQGYDVPPTPTKGKKGSTATSAIARAQAVLAKPSQPTAAALAAGTRTVEAQQQRQTRAIDEPVVRQYAQERDTREDWNEGEETVVDMMTPNAGQVMLMESINEGYFREFKSGEPIQIGTEGDGRPVLKFAGQIEYEKFMQEPVVIRVHSTKDRNESRLVYVGINGDSRWLERDKNYRLPRKFVERLIQAQEMAFRTVDNADPTVDNAMKLIKSLAASYEFSIIRDDSPVGARWRKRMKRDGS